MAASLIKVLERFGVWAMRPELPLWFVLACLPLLPSSCFINRGYTQWFLWGAIVYKLTHHPLLPPFLAVQGLLINVGWYMTLTLDYVQDGRFLHILIRNMPEILTVPHVVDGPNVTGQEIRVHRTTTSFLGQLLCLGLDLCIHPLLCYYFWYTCWNSGLTTHKDIASWKNIIAAVLFSKIWSILHCWIHYETWGLYYYGSHVYTVPENVDHLWTAAYVGEATAIVLLRLHYYYCSCKRRESK
jgi:hypothetical protein